MHVLRIEKFEFEFLSPKHSIFRILHCGVSGARFLGNNSVFYVRKFSTVFLYFLCDLDDCKC